MEKFIFWTGIYELGMFVLQLEFEYDTLEVKCTLHALIGQVCCTAE